MSAALLDEFGIGDALARTESWRYSKLALRALERNDFVAADGRAPLPPELVARFDWPATRGRRAVFVNGSYSESLSDCSALRRARPDIRFDIRADSVAATLPPGRVDLLHLVYVNVPGTSASRWRQQLRIELEGGHLGLIEQHVGVDGSDVLGALTSDVSIGARADMRLTTLSDLPDSASLYRRQRIAIAAEGACRSTHALFGGRLQRFDLDVAMMAPGALYQSRGVFALRSRQHVDVHLDVRHAARDTRSDVVWRGVADQRSRGILHGAITVASGADGADAQLQTKNLLLSAHAEIDAQPVLEIYADEVKASHGATVGQLDERALFYLRSRGLPASQARNLLIAGFCREALSDIGDTDMRARLDALLDERLPRSQERDT